MTAGLKEAIQQYITLYPSEETTAKRYLALLDHPDAFQRSHLPGHITGSAFIVSGDFRQTLLVHHVKLNRWLQPGGHADGNTNVIGVALREAEEETGIARLELLSPAIYDLDIHPIPARKDFPAHDHYDMRYLIKASTLDTITVSEESHDVRWVELAELERYNTEPSLLRLREKLPLL
jgi:8-oxo-dGTP pyrophosphatase MutT (NUDIX family)